MEQVNAFVRQANAALQTTPAGQQFARLPLTFSILLFSLLLHLICLVGDEQTMLNWLAVSPSATLMAGKFWTIITSSLLENNSTKFFVFGAFVCFASYQLENEWGTVPLAKHLVMVAVLSSLGSALVFIAVYMTTLNEEIFFSHVFGLGGFAVALHVALLKHKKLRIVSAETEDTRRTSPESLVTIPAILAYSLLGLRFPLHDALLVVFAFFVSVLNLRSEDFSFRTFLPLGGSRASLAHIETVTPIPALASPDPTKERFRQRGFKLLDKKLAELEAAPEIPLDGGGNESLQDKLDKA